MLQRIVCARGACVYVADDMQICRAHRLVGKGEGVAGVGKPRARVMVRLHCAFL